jgi:hypothetical protein
MKTLCMLLLLCAFGCSQTEQPPPMDAPAVNNAPSTTLANLVYVDMFAPDYTTQHPLVGRSAGGRDMAFRHTQSGETIHAVFPKGVSAPEALDGHFVLHCHYSQAVLPGGNDKSVVKRPKEVYRYFAVSSWKQKK